EIKWHNIGGEWRPRATKPLSARVFGYPYEMVPEGDPEDRLMLDPDGNTGLRRFVDFPPGRFLVAINRGHGGHAAMAAPLRALVPYWLAAVYGLKWSMNYAQLYG